MKTGIFSSELNNLLQNGELGWWEDFFKAQREKGYFAKLEEFLNEEYQRETIYPKVSDIFSAFKYTSSGKINMILIGQDPYHGEGQGMGLSFSVRSHIKIPPSLRNIYKELESDLGIIRTTGDLSDIASQGVFLLNTVLTVKSGQANSHAKMGWEEFTKSAVGKACENNPHLVMLLLGKPQEKFETLARKENFIIKTSHPSPLSAYRGFLGSGIFSRANEFLQKHNASINWQQPKETQ